MREAKILHEDADIIVCVKPSGVDSQLSAGQNLPAILSERTGCEIYPVHRLDRGTEGVMVYAKTSRAAKSLSEAFASGTADKTYLAVLCGSPSERLGNYEDLLYHDQRKNKSYVVARKRAGVKRASLSYETLAQSGAYTLVRVKLHTGRTHQVRVQFASRKTPLLGDVRYGGQAHPAIAKGAFALAAVSLSFTHPASGERMEFSFSPVGEAWDIFAQFINDNL